MPCLVALLVLSVLGIFSASHRKLAKEAFDCVFRRVTMRPCTTGFDVKVKTAVLGPILSKLPRVAKWVNRYFETLSWIFMLLMVGSLVWTLQGVYNFWAWGDCNGQFSNGGFCVFDPSGANNKATGVGGEECVDQGLASQTLSRSGMDTNIFPIITWGTSDHPDVLFVGCYACDYTRAAYPVLKAIFAETQSRVRFAHFPTKKEAEYLLPYDVCVSSLAPDIYAEFVDRLFTSSKEDVADAEHVIGVVTTLGLDKDEFMACLDDEGTAVEMTRRHDLLLEMGIYGTPTVFVDDTALVGPKPNRVYRRLMTGSLFNSE